MMMQMLKLATIDFDSQTEFMKKNHHVVIFHTQKRNAHHKLLSFSASYRSLAIVIQSLSIFLIVFCVWCVCVKTCIPFFDERTKVH